MADRSARAGSIPLEALAPMTALEVLMHSSWPAYPVARATWRVAT